MDTRGIWATFSNHHANVRQRKGPKNPMIDGVIISPRKIIPDDRGKVLHMLKRTDPEFQAFGEIYFSTIYPGVVKGWHLHREMVINYVV
ncbi:MAG: hypothetical protein ACREJX_20990, partial [Polyangiaceae bacterium]